MLKFSAAGWALVRALYRRRLRERHPVRGGRRWPQPFCFHLFGLRLRIAGRRARVVEASRLRAGWAFGVFVRTRGFYGANKPDCKQGGGAHDFVARAVSAVAAIALRRVSRGLLPPAVWPSGRNLAHGAAARQRAAAG